MTIFQDQWKINEEWLEKSSETKIIATQVCIHIQTYKNHTHKHIHQKIKATVNILKQFYN